MHYDVFDFGNKCVSDSIITYSEEEQKFLNAKENYLIQLTENNTKTEELVILQKRLESEYLQLARNLSDKRHQDIKNLSKSIGQELANLNLENTVFEVDLNSTEEEISEKGIDHVITGPPGPRKDNCRIRGFDWLNNIIFSHIF